MNNLQTNKVLEGALKDVLSSLKEILEEIRQSANTDEIVKPNTKPASRSLLTNRTMLELVYHEGIVKEAYKDSVGIWTWGIGVTDASGHSVGRYKDNPQSIPKVLEIFKWLVETKYLPPVLEVFKGHDLSETQLAAAVSFHYNTGAISRASWVKSFKKGQISKAKREFMNWKKPSEIIPRRRAERDLFFDGVWTNDGKATVYERVRKPSYAPVWSSAKRVDIVKDL